MGKIKNLCCVTKATCYYHHSSLDNYYLCTRFSKELKNFVVETKRNELTKVSIYNPILFTYIGYYNYLSTK